MGKLSAQSESAAGPAIRIMQWLKPALPLSDRLKNSKEEKRQNGKQSRFGIHGSRERRGTEHRLSQTGHRQSQMRAWGDPEDRLHEYLRQRSAHGQRAHHGAAWPDSRTRDYR